MPKFSETIENSRVFLTYSLAMTMLGKAAAIIAARGGDKKAMSFITTGIELLVKQLRDYADEKDLEDEAGELLKPLLGNADGSQETQASQESNNEDPEKITERLIEEVCKIHDIQRANQK